MSVRKIIANFVLSSIRNAPRHFSNFISLAFLLRFENFWSLSLSLFLSPGLLVGHRNCDFLSRTWHANTWKRFSSRTCLPSVRHASNRHLHTYARTFARNYEYLSQPGSREKFPPSLLFDIVPFFSQESREKRNIIREVKQKFKKILWNSDLSSISNNVKTR